MEEIDLLDLWNYFIRKRKLILLIIGTILLIGSIYTLIFQFPKYKVTSSIALVAPDGRAITNGDIVTNNNLIKNYTSAVKSSTILQKVIDNLKLDVDCKKLANDLNITQDIEGQKIKIEVISYNKNASASIANEIAKVSLEEIPKIYKSNNIKIVEEATPPKHFNHVNMIKEIIIYLLIGIVVSFGTVFIEFYFDKTVRNEKQIESSFNIPIIGRIPEKEGRLKHGR